MQRTLLLTGVMLALMATCATAAAVTPEGIKAFFDANAVFIMFVWGLIVKYVPGLAKIPNDTIPWLNSVGYVLAGLGGTAIAQAVAPVAPTPGLTDVAGTLIVGAFGNSIIASLLYERFGRSILEKIFKLKKAVPA